MSFLSFFLGEKKKTASVAKERLQIILAHERAGRGDAGAPDYLPDLQRDLIAVISKYVKIDPRDIKVQLERQDDLEVLEVKIELPEKTPPAATGG
ncbi:cell division topological specificity factor MinE [Comamonadaceae bacterium OH2545_COT-014]|nr:cell division topological specificity factor MinE [Comamonadaceae bacterium OH2545_COT-014]